MKFDQLQSKQFAASVRHTLERELTRHQQLDYSQLFSTCTSRALGLWNRHLVPELDIESQRQFERALVAVDMRAGRAIPWTLASGYAFGAACHVLAGGAASEREDVATTTGLYMFILGLFDHLLDEFPQEFGNIGQIITKQSLQCWVEQNDLSGVEHSADKPLAAGLMRLYKLYFMRSQRLLARGQEQTISATWLDALQTMHRVETESTDRRMNVVQPSKELIDAAAQPSLQAFWVLAISACLGLGDEAAQKIKSFALDYGRLTWLVDDVMDLPVDIKNGIWSGLAVRLSLETQDQQQADKLVQEVAQDCVQLMTQLYDELGDVRWQDDDPFSLADILWAYLWAWLGGQYEDNPVAIQQRNAAS